MSATLNAMAKFNELNARMHQLVTAKIQAVFGTIEEREVLRNLTQQGIESADEICKLIEEGITYEKWSAFLQRVNRIDGPLAVFENEDGDMAKLVNEFCTTDLSGAFEEIKKGGFFQIEVVQRDRALLVQRLEWAESMWKQNDEQDQKIANLQAIDTSEEPK